MTVAAALLALMAGSSANATITSHPGLDPGPMNTDLAIWNPSVFVGPGLRRDDSVVVLALQDAPPSPPQTPPAPEPQEDYSRPAPTPSEGQLIDDRRRPGVPQHDLPDAVNQVNPGAIRQPPPEAFPAEHVAIPDRWRLAESLGLVHPRWWDPYNQNTLKGDRPICDPADESEARRASLGCRTHRLLGLHEPDWFFAFSAISDTVIEPRTFPIPVGVQTTQNPGSIDVFGRNHSLVLAQTFIASVALIKGNTAFVPPHVEYRLTLALNVNYVDVGERRILFVAPSEGTDRVDYALGVQEAFVDYHIRNVSDRFDFDSVRVGIQPFNFDFRGFLFQDQQLGIRLFGNRDNNRFQYNIAAIWRLEKDTNSGLNNVLQGPRDDWILHANLFRQDFPFVGLTSQVSLTYNMNRERGQIEVDDNGFPVRPALFGNLRARNYDAVYLGYSVDGRIGRVNLAASAYALGGSDRANVFTGRNARIQSLFAAAEPSIDMDWIRIRGAALFASGDGDPYDDVERGFDAIFENPIFAGADTSYWIRQTIPFAGGGRAVSVNGRNGILNSLRSSKEQGQTNFANPGTMLLGLGADFDLTPRLRVSANANHLWFHQTEILQDLRMQGTIRRDIGWDLSAAAIWRPRMTQNIVFRLSGAMLQSGTGFRDLFENLNRDRRYYSVLLNAIVTY
ncbi:MAG: hypothetical protein QOH47_2896 [Sphingomonadales bacterium]|jgi:hypothetical protein|nr:hypothetical protein [Sphingomonadales bacterium]